MEALLNKLESYGFACEAGPLINCEDWKKLRAMLGEQPADEQAKRIEQRSDEVLHLDSKLVAAQVRIEELESQLSTARREAFEQAKEMAAKICDQSSLQPALAKRIRALQPEAAQGDEPRECGDPEGCLSAQTCYFPDCVKQPAKGWAK